MDIPSICSVASVVTGSKSYSKSRMDTFYCTNGWMFYLEDIVGQGTVLK